MPRVMLEDDLTYQSRSLNARLCPIVATEMACRLSYSASEAIMIANQRLCYWGIRNLYAKAYKVDATDIYTFEFDRFRGAEFDACVDLECTLIEIVSRCIGKYVPDLNSICDGIHEAVLYNKERYLVATWHFIQHVIDMRNPGRRLIFLFNSQDELVGYPIPISSRML
jgi:hypothetical protein